MRRSMNVENTSSTNPRNIPIATEIITTMVVSRLVSSRDGQLTFFSSDMESVMNRNLPKNDRWAAILSRAGRVNLLISSPCAVCDLDSAGSIWTAPAAPNRSCDS